MNKADVLQVGQQIIGMKRQRDSALAALRELRDAVASAQKGNAFSTTMGVIGALKTANEILSEPEGRNG